MQCALSLESVSLGVLKHLNMFTATADLEKAQAPRCAAGDLESSDFALPGLSYSFAVFDPLMHLRSTHRRCS